MTVFELDRTAYEQARELPPDPSDPVSGYGHRRDARRSELLVGGAPSIVPFG